MFSFPHPALQSEHPEGDMLRAMPTPIARPGVQGYHTMFYLPESRYGEQGVITRVPQLDLEGNPSTFFPGMEVERGSSANTNTMLNTVATGGENRTLPFFHELDIHLQDDSNSSIMKQVMSHDETMSLFPEIKLAIDEEDAKTTSLPEITGYDAVSFNDQGIRSEGSKTHSQFAAGLMYEQGLHTPVPNARIVYQESQHEMMQEDYGDRREEEVFHAQLQSQVCQSQQSKIGRGGSLPVFNVSTAARRGNLVPYLPLLPSAGLRQNLISFSPSSQNLMSFSPTPLNEENGLSPSPSRKLETVGGKKMFSSHHRRPSSSLISSNLNGSEEYKMVNPCNPPTVREYIASESKTMSTPMKHDNFMSPSSLLDSMQVGQNPSMIPSSLKNESFQEQLLSPAFVASIQPNCVEAIKGLRGLISNNCTRPADHLADSLGSHGYTLSSLQNTSTLPYMGSMQSMMMEHTDDGAGLNVIYPIPSSFSVGRNPSLRLMEDATRSTLREDLMASNANATMSQSHMDMVMEDLKLLGSRSFEVFQKAGLMSSGNLFDINGTVRLSSIPKDTIETEVLTPDPSCTLRNCGKEKRWIYKQARLPKKRPLTAGDPMNVTTRRKRGKFEEKIEEKVKVKSELDISACAPDANTEELQVHCETSSTSSSLSEKCKALCVSADPLFGEGNSIPHSMNDFLKKSTASISETLLCRES